jgi:hypothetical protein
MSSTTKTPEHIVPAYNLPENADTVAEAARSTEAVEAVEAAEAAEEGRMVCRR